MSVYEYVAKLQISEEGEEVPIRDVGAVRSSELFDLIYPVGSIYMSVNSVNPSTLFGGVWEAWGEGRVPVGVGTADGKTFAANEQGGKAEVTLTSAQSGVPAHNHGLNSHKHTYDKTNANTGSHVLTISEMPSHNHNKKTLSGWFDLRRWGRSGSMVVDNGGIVSQVGKTVVANGTGQVSENDGTVQTIVINATHTHDSQGGGSGHTHTIGTTSTNSGPASGSTANNTAANASSAHTNLQPYITCYMWKRVS